MLEEYARPLQIAEGSNQWYQFFDLAAIEKGRVPLDILREEELVERLPVVFRTLRGQKVSAERLNDLAEQIRRA